MSWVLVQCVLCVLVADFLTGLVHWWEDAYAVRTWPEPLRTEVVDPNIRHHNDPTHFVRGTTFWRRNYPPILMAASVLAIAWPLGLLTWQLAVVAAVASLGNETHAWAHVRPPRVVRALQEMGLLTTPQQHAKHHKRPYDRAYCCITNALNPLLDGLLFWRGLEWLIACVGVPVKRGSVQRGGV